MTSRYSQQHRDVVFTKKFLTTLHALGSEYPAEFIVTVHSLLNALLESERHVRSLEEENNALWKVLYNGKESGQ